MVSQYERDRRAHNSALCAVPCCMALCSVQNRYLWKRYMHERKLLHEATAGRGVNQRWLWHGTACIDPYTICTGLDGFDCRMVSNTCTWALASAGVLRNRVLRDWQAYCGFFGRGTYFAEKALYSHTSYSHRTAQGTHQLILARVLCGNSKDMGRLINRTLVKPPHGYNSVRGGPHTTRTTDPPASASICWAVYDRAQSYPAYVVTYKTRATTLPRPRYRNGAKGALLP